MEDGFYTAKAKETDDGGLEAVVDHLKTMRDRLEARPDFKDFI